MDDINFMVGYVKLCSGYDCITINGVRGVFMGISHDEVMCDSWNFTSVYKVCASYLHLCVFIKVG